MFLRPETGRSLAGGDVLYNELFRPFVVIVFTDDTAPIVSEPRNSRLLSTAASESVAWDVPVALRAVCHVR